MVGHINSRLTESVVKTTGGHRFILDTSICKPVSFFELGFKCAPVVSE